MCLTKTVLIQVVQMLQTPEFSHKKMLPFLLISVLFQTIVRAQIYDTSQLKANIPLLTTSCNSSTIIYLSFNPTSSLTCSSSSAGCSVSVAESSRLTHLDVLGNYKQYKLAEAQAVKQTFLAGFPYAFLFKFIDDSKSSFIYVAVPFTNGPPNSDYLIQTISLNSTKDPSLSSLKQFSLNPDSALASGLALSAFNFLNTADFNEFYEVMDQTKTRILLVSKLLFKVSQDATNLPTNSIFPTNFTADYQGTADILCWGSFTEGQSNLPMRRNAPLWFFLVAALAAWLFVLIGEESTSEIFQIKFKDNIWTCWSLYSLFYLAHDQFFTRMSRTSLLLLTIFWQGFIVTIIYFFSHSSQGNFVVILAAFLGWLLSVPIPFLFGNAYLLQLKELKIRKYKDLIDLKEREVNESEKAQLQRDTIINEQDIRNLYFMYYVAVVVSIVLIFTLCVLGMSTLTYYYFFRNEQWLISMAAILVFDNFVFEPACTALFGHTKIYRSRGYYYNGQIAEDYRKAD